MKRMIKATEETAESIYPGMTREQADDMELHDFSDRVEEELKTLFPNSKPEHQFDFSYSQGSGFNIYGEFDINDLAKFGGVESEVAAIKDGYGYVEIQPNQNYTYCMWDPRLKTWKKDDGSSYEYLDGPGGDIHDYLIDDYYVESPLDDETATKVSLAICDKMEDLCKKFYDEGDAVFSYVYDLFEKSE